MVKETISRRNRRGRRNRGRREPFILDIEESFEATNILFIPQTGVLRLNVSPNAVFQFGPLLLRDQFQHQLAPVNVFQDTIEIGEILRYASKVAPAYAPTKNGVQNPQDMAIQEPSDIDIR